MRLGIAVLAFAALSLAIPGSAAALNMQWGFDADDEGWTVDQDGIGAGADPTFSLAGGNPGGHISTVDSNVDDSLHFYSPALTAGSLAPNYLGRLSFDYKRSFAGRDFFVLRIQGAGTDYMFQLFGLPKGSSDVWQHKSLLFVELGAWYYCDPPAACTLDELTQAEFRTELSQATSFHINPDVPEVMGTLGDTYALDNVVLTERPPSSPAPPFVPPLGGATGAPVGAPSLAPKCKKGRKLRKGKCVKKKRK